MFNFFINSFYGYKKQTSEEKLIKLKKIESRKYIL